MFFVIRKDINKFTISNADQAEGDVVQYEDTRIVVKVSAYKGKKTMFQVWQVKEAKDSNKIISGKAYLIVEFPSASKNWKQYQPTGV